MKSKGLEIWAWAPKKDLNEEKMEPLNLCGWVFKLFAIARLESYTNRASSSGPPVLKKRSDGRKFPKRTRNQSKDQFRRSNLMARSRKKRLIMNWTIGSVFWEVSGLAPCSSEIFLSGQWFRTTLLSFNLGLDLPFRFIPIQFFLARRYVVAEWSGIYRSTGGFRKIRNRPCSSIVQGPLAHTCIRVKSLAGVGVHVSRDVSMPFGQGGVLLDLAGQFHHSPCHGG